ncbi:MAG: HAD-IC family P-type ATPase, partial [Candidatus Margulisiibacteriota bacterium]
VGITIYQQNKTERALSALRDLSSPRALVIRDGEQKRIPGRNVVIGDVLVLKEGDRIPADAVLLWGMNLTVDESLLTGESSPVAKHPGEGLLSQRPGGENTPFLFSGTLVTQGQGVAQVSATGLQTEMGRIGQSLKTILPEPTTLQLEIGNLVRMTFLASMGLSLMIFLLYGVFRQDWLAGLLSGITLAMAMIPEEFPVVLTLFLAIGAWRLSRQQVLTRKVSSIEMLGAATILCTDKTGTLTENKMTIQYLVVEGQSLEVGALGVRRLPEVFHEIVEYGLLASKKDPFDPMEKALAELGYSTLQATEHLHEDWPMIGEYPLSKELLALSHVWKCDEQGIYVVAAKGAPEAISNLCHLTSDEEISMLEQVQDLARKGQRVLGVAKADFKRLDLPSNQHDFEFQFLGLIGWTDPIRESVPQSVQDCYQAGIRVMMITGDYPATAEFIARQIGMKMP